MNEQDYILDDPCLDEGIIRGYIFHDIRDPEDVRIIESHLRVCLDCAAVARKLTRLRLGPETIEKMEIERALQSLRKPEITSGGVWRTVPVEKRDLYGPLVLVLQSRGSSERRTIRVAEVSEDIPNALDTDVIIDPRSSGLSFTFMVRAENIFPMSNAKLKAFAGTLPAAVAKLVRRFCLDPVGFESVFDLSDYEFFRMGEGEGVVYMRRGGLITGIPCETKEDRRLKELRTAKNRTAYLVDPTPRLDRELPELLRAVVDGNLNHLKRMPQSVVQSFGKHYAGLGFTTPLHWACLEGHGDVVSFLLENEAVINAEDAEGNTPLMWAIRHNQVGVAKLLLSKGADGSVRNQQGQTARDLALETGNKDLMNILRGK
jgi:hypothetical protein